MKLKEIQYTAGRDFFELSYRTKDGSLLKEKYMGYKLGEAKQLFKAKFKNLI